MRISTGLLLVALAILIAVGGLVFVQRLVPTDRRKQHNDVAGFIYAVLGVAYAVLLGLMLIAVWEKWNAAEVITTDEANELAGLFWYAHALPPPEGRHIQELVRSYDRVVIEEEWPLMAQGSSSPEVWATLDELRGAILGLEPPKGAKQTGYDQMRYDEMLEQLHDLGNARRERLLAAEQGLPPILWVVLILGGVVTVGFTFPLRLGEHPGAPAYGSGIGLDHLHESVHRCRPRLPLQGRYTYPPDCLRERSREVSREQA
jgi:Protein of unknown function (DUF4239)